MQHMHEKSGLAIYFRLLKAVKPYWYIFAAGILATFLASGTDAILAWTVKPIIDKGLVGRNLHFLMWLPVFIILIFVMRALTNFTSNYCISYVGRSVVMDFRQKIFAHLQKLPASFYDTQSTGKLLSMIIYNVSQLAQATTDALLTMLQEGSMAFGLLIVMFIVSWQLTLLFIIFAPLLSGIIHIMVKRQRKLSTSVQDSVADVTHIARESIDGYKVIRTFGAEDHERDKFNRASRANRHREMKVIITNALGTSGVQIILAIPIVIVIYIIAFAHLNISVGSFGALAAAALRILTPIRRLTKVTTSFQKGIAGAESIFNLLDESVEKDHGEQVLERAKGKIEYQGISFAYPHIEEKIVLNKINCCAEPGQIIALVGHSGAGKSTFVNLLPRFYDVNHGTILIDDVDIHDYKLVDLRRQFSFVSQNIILFNDTIANNIAYGKLADTSEEDVIKAARAANVMEFVKQLPDGLNTLIGENGLMLSGGQRQRVAIARAILKDAPILILDEATSALDTESERYLQSALEKLMQKRTTLVIAHRLSTVEKADCILVLDEGKIIEQGTHKQLVAANGYYAKLYKMQFSE
jgi:subfamily B ATP-binding cassette protein MsbA